MMHKNNGYHDIADYGYGDSDYGDDDYSDGGDDYRDSDDGTDHYDDCGDDLLLAMIVTMNMMIGMTVAMT